VAGELTFEQGPEDGVVRMLTALTVEDAAAKPRPPVVKTDLAFLKVGDAKLTESRPYLSPDSDVVTRAYEYEVTLENFAPTGSASGDVIVVDPWDEGREERLRAHVDVKPSIKVIPARVVLEVDKAEGGGEADVLVICQSPTSDLRVEQADGTPPLFEISPIRMSKDQRRGAFTISLKAEASEGAKHALRVSNPATGESAEVPVHVYVRAGAKP
jgi:hypothetical protein